MKRRGVVPVTVVLIAGLLAGALGVRERLASERLRSGLRGVELEKLPPLGAAGLLLLGGFRGVAVDILWLRVFALHQKRRYEEERSFIELITRLQPYTSGVWVWQGFNIAYNISVQYTDPADQWNWVRNGVEFLKQGLELNPGDANLWFNLAWVHFNKMSQNPYFEEACERDLKVNNFEEAARYYRTARSICFYLLSRHDEDVRRNPHFEAEMEKDIGVKGFAGAAEHFKDVRGLKEVETFHPRVVDSGVFDAYLARSRQVLGRGALTPGLDFTPGTLRTVQPFIDLCREEADGLSKRWPTDAAFEMQPARIDLLFADGYVAQADQVLAGGDFGAADVERARKMLDKALDEVRKYRPTYEGTRSELVIRNKTGDILQQIPQAVVRHVNELLDKPFAGVRELHRAVELLRLAENELKDGQDRLALTPAELERVRGLLKLTPAEAVRQSGWLRTARLEVPVYLELVRTLAVVSGWRRRIEQHLSGTGPSAPGVPQGANAE